VAARRKQVVEPQSATRQEQDEWDRKLWRETGLAIGQWLIDAKINLNRPLQSLTLIELQGMSWAAIGVYNDLRAQREREEEGRSDPLSPDSPTVS
jgi:hypothetical protein